MILFQPKKTTNIISLTVYSLVNKVFYDISISKYILLYVHENYQIVWITQHGYVVLIQWYFKLSTKFYILYHF